MTEPSGSSNREYEKKFFVPPSRFSLIPGITSDGDNWCMIRQGYLCLDDYMEERIRTITHPSGAVEHYHVYKGKGTSSRFEYPPEDGRYAIPEELARYLWSKPLVGQAIDKKRYGVMEGGQLYQVDEYLTFPGLYTAEAEVQDEAALSTLVLPDYAFAWIDITKDKSMKNNSLAVHGLPTHIAMMIAP